jgi:hypothetical protein
MNWEPIAEIGSTVRGTGRQSAASVSAPAAARLTGAVAIRQ